MKTYSTKQVARIVGLPFTAVLAAWLLGYFLLSYALAFGVVLAIGAVALVVEAVGSFLHTAFRRKTGWTFPTIFFTVEFLGFSLVVALSVPPFFHLEIF